MTGHPDVLVIDDEPVVRDAVVRLTPCVPAE